MRKKSDWVIASSIGLLLFVVVVVLVITPSNGESRIGSRSESVATSQSIDSLRQMIDSTHLSRLYKFDSLRAVADTAAMCNKILANWFSIQEDIAYGPAGLFSNSYGTDSSNLTGLTKASARFLKHNCGPVLSTVDAVDERYRSYRDALRIAFLLKL